MQIPDEIFDIYRGFADDFISSNFGVNCRLIYPSTKTPCVNCVYDTLNQKSGNVYKSGGPAPFNFGLCPLCGGQGYTETEQSEVLKLRLYFSRKDWVKINTPILVPNGAIQMIGFLTDLPKIRKASYIILYSDQDGYQNWAFDRDAEAHPFGFKKDRYFVGFLGRTNG